MFKKLIVAMLILGFASAIPVMAQDGTTKSKYANHTSKRAVFMSMVIAARDNNPDMLWDCFSPSTQKKMTDLCQKSKVPLNEFKADMCKEIREAVLQELKARNNDVNKFVDEAMKEEDEAMKESEHTPFVNIKGKWYIEFKF